MSTECEPEAAGGHHLNWVFPSCSKQGSCPAIPSLREEPRPPFHCNHFQVKSCLCGYNGESIKSEGSSWAIVETQKCRVKSACSMLGVWGMPRKKGLNGPRGQKILEKDLHCLKTVHSTLSQSGEMTFNT